MQENWQFEMNM